MRNHHLPQFLPLHPVQEAIYFDQAFDETSSKYTIGGYLAIRGELRTDLFREAVAHRWQVSDTPKARFDTDDGVPRQCIDAASPMPELVMADFRTSLDPQAAARHWMQGRMHVASGADAEPLLEHHLLQVADDEWYFFVRTHHLVMDGYSFGIHFSNVGACYATLLAGGESAPADGDGDGDGDGDYARAIAAGIDYLQSPAYSEDSLYWRDKFPQPLAPVLLPHYPQADTKASAQLVTALAPELREQLRALCKETKVSMLHVTLAALAICVPTPAGGQCLVVGIPVHNRVSRNERMVSGPLSNTIACEVAFDGGATLRELLGTISSSQRRDLRHRHYPLSHFARQLGLHQVKRANLFDIVVNYGVFGASTELLDCSMTRYQLSNLSEQIPLHVKWSDYGDGQELVLHIDYLRNYFSDTDIAGFEQRFLYVLGQFPAGLEHAADEIEALPQAELRRQLIDWNDSTSPYPDQQTVAALFAQQAARTPAAVAVVCGDDTLIYAQLNQKANRLARHLRKLGVSPGVLVGVCVERSLDMAVGLLAILKAGGAYVPLDPEYPPERLAHMLGDALPAVLLGHERLLGMLPDGAAARFCIDSCWDQLAGYADTNLPEFARAADLAYVIYTSGSTGEPKGVSVSHQAIARLVFDQRYIALGAGDRVAQAASSSFDALTFELWGALLHGCQLCIVPYETVVSAPDFAAEIKRRDINVLFITTALFNQFALHAPDAFSGVRDLLFGGEAVDPRAVDKVLRTAAPARLLHVYGPTESTTFALWHEVGQVHPAATTVPIGKPIANTQIYVLGADLKPVPIGAPGELHIGGGGLARGYLNRPELTAENFIPNPFGEVAGARLYKTGDRVRFLDDGSIEYLDRTDRQIKLRGFRIELGEIEAALAALPEVRKGVVLVREDAPGDRRLVAYVLAVEGSAPGAAALRESLKASLPDYMVPSAVVLMEAFPLTTNGKIDRRALPAPVYGEEAGEWIAPVTLTEQKLALLWQQVLSLDAPVGRNANFFAQGGHSLLATRLISLVRREMSAELALKTLFDVQTLSGLAASIDSAGGHSAWPVIARAERLGPLPLSFGQQRLWFIDQLGGGSAQYNMPAALHLAGQLDATALEQALDAIVSRHVVLRTRFAEEDGVAFQVIGPDEGLELARADLSRLTDEERERALAERMAAEARRPFDLRHDLTLRAQLICCADDEHVLLLTMHHIASDGWAVGVLCQELELLYGSYATGRKVGLLPLAIQYSDYACWQRDWLQGKTLATQLVYWTQQLEGIPQVHSLPLDRPRPPVATFVGAVHTSSVDASAFGRLCRAHGATLFMGLHAAFATLLSRYSGETDIVVGSPVANREQAEVARLIGFFVNTLVLRSDLSGQPSFIELLAQSRETALGAFAHQQVPFESLIELLQPERSTSHAPLFQVMLALQNNQNTNFRLPGVKVTALTAPWQAAKFDLTLNVTEQGDTLELIWEYNTDLFDETTIARMDQHFARLLDAIVAAPAAPVAMLALLDATARAQLVARWNATAPACTVLETVHTLFESCAKAAPDSIALVFEGGTMTYRDLNRRANRLAHHLRNLGVGPDVMVGISVERSPDMVAGLLAILKAGGAYVPLDPAYPAERIAFMLADTGATLVVSRDMLVLDAKLVAACPDTNPALPVNPAQLAYCMYTSGSTGKPKGLAIPHLAMLGFMRGVSYAKFDASCAMLQYSSTSWDALTLELWPVLVHGGRCVLFTGSSPAPSDLARHIREDGVNLMWITSAFFNVVVDQDPALLAGLTQLLVGGDQVSPGHVRKLRHAQPGLRVVNGYGPSECTVFSTCHVLEGETPQRLPIGRAVGDRVVYLLDAGLEPVADGMRGEICVAGDALARGYLNLPALTAEKFVPNPHGAPGTRIYRTGDIGRVNAAGELDFIGRLDQQVKLRGFRIELGEIEAALAALPAVRDSVVLMREDTPGDQRLAAYLTVRDGEMVTVASLRAALAQTLPDFMVPSHFMVLERLPLTANGKIDRHALPVPVESREQMAYVAPRGAVEEALVAIWSEVLRVDQVGVRDNFFALGGHSLLATQVMSKIAARFQTELKLRTLFAGPTVAQLAEQVELARNNPDNETLPPLLRADRGAALPLSFAQQRLWFIDQLQPHNSCFNMPEALRIRGSLDVAALEQALLEIVRRHAILRTCFAADQDAPVQRIGNAPACVLDITDLSSLPPADSAARLRTWLAESAHAPFSLSRGPLFRAGLAMLDAEQHVLLLNMHHIVSDGWSMPILKRELAVLYEQFSKGLPSLLLPLALQYSDFAAWQREWLRGDKLGRQLDYWAGQLAGAPVLALPTDRLRPRAQSYGGALHEFTLDKELGSAVAELCLAQDATPFMTLLAAFQVFLSRLTGQADISVGTTIANRTSADTEYMVGFFANLLVLRAHIDSADDFLGLLRQVRLSTLDAYAHQDVSFQQVVERVQPVRDVSRSPLFQVNFVLHNTRDATSHLGAGDGTPQFSELEVEAEDTGFTVALYDLSLHVINRSGRLHCGLLYNTALFDSATVERWGQGFASLLQALLAAPARSLAALDVSAAESDLLAVWGAGRRPARSGACLPVLFEEQVARAPDAPALVDGDATLSYAQLNARANRLAHFLRAGGVGPETRVALCMGRSVDAIVAILGIIKAGACYVPLDPEYPERRLAYLMDQVRPGAIVAHDSALDGLPAMQLSLIFTVCVDTDAAAIARQPDTNPAPVGVPSHMACVMFTSGSSGKPKGVMVEHGNIVRLFYAPSFADIAATDVFLQAAPLSFDGSTLEIWSAFLNGACLAIPAPGLHIVDAIGQAGRRHGVNSLWLSAGLFNQMVEHHPDSLRNMRLLMTGGDAVSPLHVRRARALLAHGQVVNGYGPTETTVFATTHTTTGDAREEHAIPIGRAVAGASLHVLDEILKLAPAGAVGELCIGGEGVTRGYLGDPSLTARRFVPDPFSALPGARMYRSGDLVRWLPDGRLDFVGRADKQIKVRGFRIEPGEIETVLLEDARVGEAAVVAWAPEQGEKLLVGYWVPADSGVNLDSASMKARLRERLPDYMVPTLLVRVAALPLTPNGKVDAAALPSPLTQVGAAAVPAEQQTEQQTMLVAIWQELLRIGGVGIDESFFDLGGDSLRAIQLKAEVLKNGYDFELHQLFSHQTVRELSTLLTPLAAGAEPAMLAPFALISEQARASLPEGAQDAYPVSHLQLGMLYHSLYEPGSGFYHDVITYRLHVPFDHQAWVDVLAELAARHPILRTGFRLSGDGHPLQIVYADAEVPLIVEDWRADSEAVRSERLQAWPAAQSRSGFDWERAPLLRVYLHRLRDGELQLGLNFHHAIMDGWSEASLAVEIMQRYQARRDGHALAMPPIAVSYRDYIALEQEALSSEKSLSYWTQKLDGHPDIRITRGPAPTAQPTFDEVTMREIAISTKLSQNIYALAKHLRVPIKSVLLAAHAKALGILSGSSAIMTGVATHGRPECADGDKVIGLFLNTLPFRVDLVEGDWRQLVATTAALEQELFLHRYYPLHKIMQLGGGHRLFDTLFNYTHFHNYEQLGEQGANELVRGGFAQSSLPFVANFFPGRDQHIKAFLSCNKAHYPESLVEECAACYEAVLEAMVADPSRSHTMSALLPDDSHASMTFWNETDAPYPANRTVHALFEEQAARAPGCLAAVCGEGELHYGELNRKANRLARHLQSLGVGPGVLVGVCVERSLDMVVGLLAILKAGGAYVPLDPAYPAERLAYMLDDARPAVLLGEERLLATLPAGPAARFGIDSGWPELAGYADTNLEQAACAADLAYVIYTSGSTGQAKGVSVSHQAVNRLVFDQRYVTLRAGDRVGQAASSSFDALTFELWGALLHGCQLCIVPYETIISVPDFAHEIKRRGINVLFLTPALFNQFAQHAPNAFGGVRDLLCGGDAMDPRAVEKVLRSAPPARLLNAYGPTESTTFALWHQVDHVKPGTTTIPIGKPIANTRIYVLGEDLNPVPIGVPGELHIGGAGLARGYLNRPELTAEKFIPNPFGDVPGARLYKTGDRARFLDDGSVEYLGRTDKQIKLRGFRIELGEIETALAALPEVREGLVLVREDAPGDRRVVAYVVPQLDSTAAGIRAGLARVLPGYMVPAHVVLLERLPLTPNGKIDRTALPAPSHCDAEALYLAPETATEIALAALWKTLLGLESAPGRDATFFELGGHSLLATKLVSVVRESFQVALHVKEIFQTPTLQGLARRIDAALEDRENFRTLRLDSDASNGIEQLTDLIL